MGVNHKFKGNPDAKYQRAKERVKEIKGWYNHLMVYIIINTILQVIHGGYIDGVYLYVGDSMFGHLITPVVWGTALLIHGLWVFRGNYVRRFYKDWETRKIDEFIQEDTEAFNDHQH